MIGTTTETSASMPMVPAAVNATDWRRVLPVLEAGAVTLRELQLSDAPSLLEMLTTHEVARFISPPPTSVQGFERFIDWTHRERAAGRCICFGIVPAGLEQAFGIIQVRTLTPGFDVAEWGFALGSSFWGTGSFQEAAKQVLAFVFTDVGTHRLEARAAVRNGRGNGALQKLGAIREGVLRRSFVRDGVYHDQVIWSDCQDDWRQWQRQPIGPAH